jgi:hypothetical protein
VVTKLLPVMCSVAFAACALALVGCAPEVGSERWCAMMQDKPRGDWSTNDALDYTRHCIFDRNDG